MDQIYRENADKRFDRMMAKLKQAIQSVNRNYSAVSDQQFPKDQFAPMGIFKQLKVKAQQKDLDIFQKVEMMDINNKSNKHKMKIKTESVIRLNKSRKKLSVQRNQSSKVTWNMADHFALRPSTAMELKSKKKLNYLQHRPQRNIKRELCVPVSKVMQAYEPKKNKLSTDPKSVQLCLRQLKDCQTLLKETTFEQQSFQDDSQLY